MLKPTTIGDDGHTYKQIISQIAESLFHCALRESMGDDLICDVTTSGGAIYSKAVTLYKDADPNTKANVASQYAGSRIVGVGDIGVHEYLNSTSKSRPPLIGHNLQGIRVRPYDLMKPMAWAVIQPCEKDVIEYFKRNGCATPPGIDGIGSNKGRHPNAKKARDKQKTPVVIYQTTTANESGDLVICKELVVVFESWKAIDAELFGMALRNLDGTRTGIYARRRLQQKPSRENFTTTFFIRMAKIRAI